MVRHTADKAQEAFSGVLAALLRESRRRQGLTQAVLSARTGGLVSKAALANYETGHRSLRVDIFWVLAKALGEDPGTMLAAAERGSGYGSGDATAPITVDVAAIRQSTDERLNPVRRWFTLRVQAAVGHVPIKTVTLDRGAMAALAELMGVTSTECRRILAAVGQSDRQDRADATTSSPVTAVS